MVLGGTAMSARAQSLALDSWQTEKNHITARFCSWSSRFSDCFLTCRLETKSPPVRTFRRVRSFRILGRMFEVVYSTPCR